MALCTSVMVLLLAASRAHRVAEVFDAGNEMSVESLKYETMDLDSESVEMNSSAQGCKEYGCGDSKSGPAWQVDLEGVYCSGMTFGQYTKLVEDGQCQASAIAAGEAKAKLNCYLCDVAISGHSRGSSSGKCSAKVTCAAARNVPLANVCSSKTEGPNAFGQISDVNADLALRKEYPDHACRPCPSQCSACGYEKLNRDFKCLLIPVDDNVKIPDASKYKCKDPVYRNCGGLTNWFGFWKGSCSTKHMKTYCYYEENPEFGVSNEKFSGEYFTSTMTLNAAKVKDGQDIGLDAPDLALFQGTPEYSGEREGQSFRIHFRGLKCNAFDHKPFKLEGESFEACLRQADQQGKQLAASANCALCDFNFEVDAQGVCQAAAFKPFRNEYAVCSNLPTKYTCYGDRGPLGKMDLDLVTASHQENSRCLPCPSVCDIACTKELPFAATRNALSTTFSEFTCKIYANLVKKSENNYENQVTTPDNVDSAYRCIKTQHRTCQNTWFKIGCKKEDWNSLCYWPQDFGAHEDEDNLHEHRDYSVTIGMKRQLSTAFNVFAGF